MQQPLFGSPDLTATQPRSAKTYALVSFLAFVIIIVGAVVGGTSAECMRTSRPNINPYPQRPSYSYYIYEPNYCWSSIIFTSVFVPLMIIASSLTIAALHQMSKISPAFASKSHYRCMLIWALIFSGMSLALASDGAAFSMTQGITYDVYCYGGGCDSVRWGLDSWIKKLKDDSVANRVVFIAASWLFWLYVLGSIIVQSRIKYWCCQSCKSECQHCVTSKDGCDTCLCCLYAPGEVPGGYGFQNPNVRPLVVAGQTDEATAVLQNEVEFWLNNELILPQYLEAFTRNGFDRMAAVVYGINSEQDLKEIVPDILKGHVVLILKDVERKRKQMGPSIPPSSVSGYGGVPAPPQTVGGLGESANYPRLSRTEGYPPANPM